VCSARPWALDFQRKVDEQLGFNPWQNWVEAMKNWGSAKKYAFHHQNWWFVFRLKVLSRACKIGIKPTYEAGSQTSCNDRLFLTKTNWACPPSFGIMGLHC
jgi:hypothetical protein